MSFTQWFTRSCPTVPWTPAAIATFSFVPTPSAEATRSGSDIPVKSGGNSPPNPPTSPTTPGVKVERIASFARATAPIFASISTPASAYRSGRGSVTARIVAASEESHAGRPPPRRILESERQSHDLVRGGVSGDDLHVRRGKAERLGHEREDVPVRLALLGRGLHRQLERAPVHAEDPAARGPGRDAKAETCLLYTSPSPRDGLLSRMPSSA